MNLNGKKEVMAGCRCCMIKNHKEKYFDELAAKELRNAEIEYEESVADYYITDSLLRYHYPDA